LLGGLTTGALTNVGNFPGVDTARARNLERLRSLLGDQRTDDLLSRGATMSYDELIQFAIDHLNQTNANRD